MDEIHQGVGVEGAGIIEWSLCLIGNGSRTANRYLGVVSPRSRYVRELERRWMQETEGVGVVCAVCWMRCREVRELREENTPGGIDVMLLSLRELKQEAG